LRVSDLIVTQGIHELQAGRTTYLKGPDGVWAAHVHLERSCLDTAFPEAVQRIEETKLPVKANQFI